MSNAVAAIDTEDEFRISLRVRNNRLLSAIDESGLSVRKFCKLHGLSYHQVIEMVSLKLSPVLPRGGWRYSVLKLADVIGCLPEELFPEATCVAIKQAEATFTLNARAAEAFLEEERRPDLLAEQSQTAERISEALSSLPPRIAKVLTMRFGIGGPEYSLDEVALKFDVTRERIRQLEAKGLRLLRHPARTRLRGLLDEDLDEKPAYQDSDPSDNQQEPKREPEQEPEQEPHRIGRRPPIRLRGGPSDGLTFWPPSDARALVISGVHYAPPFDHIVSMQGDTEIWIAFDGPPPEGPIIGSVGATQ